MRNLICGISYKTSLIGTIPLRVKFNKTDEFVKIYDWIRYLVLLNYMHDEICNRIKYLIREKCCITHSINNNCTKIRIDSYNYLPIEKHWIFVML